MDFEQSKDHVGALCGVLACGLILDQEGCDGGMKISDDLQDALSFGLWGQMV